MVSLLSSFAILLLGYLVYGRVCYFACMGGCRCGILWWNSDASFFLLKLVRLTIRYANSAGNFNV